jgi:hypothetical protein
LVGQVIQQPCQVHLRLSRLKATLQRGSDHALRLTLAGQVACVAMEKPVWLPWSGVDGARIDVTVSVGRRLRRASASTAVTP